MGRVKILIIRFKNEIENNEITFFRSAIIHSLGNNIDFLFYNNEGPNLNNAYPLIQYKRLNQKATLLCLNEGTDVIGKFFANACINLRIGKREEYLEIDEIRADQCVVQTWDTYYTYTLRKWLPLNMDNFEQYSNLVSINEQCLFLESILINDILSFVKRIGLILGEDLKCKILEINKSISKLNREAKMLSLDIFFKTNISIPDYIGLGRGASINQGTIKQMYNIKRNNL